jgi:hypothetical protein
MTDLSNDSDIVISIRVVVMPHTPDINHWTISLVKGDNSSIRLHMASDPEDRATKYGVAHLTYAVSQNRITDFEIRPVANLPVSYVDAVIRNKKLKNYRLTPGGSGCAYWV